MNNSIFEFHNLSNRKVPFIFHTDMTASGKSAYNVPNWHNNVEILFFTEGEGNVLCGNELHHVTEGDIFIINSNVMHYISSDSFIRYCCLIVDNDFCRDNGIDCTKLEFSNRAGTEECKRIYGKIVTEIKAENEFKDAGIRSAVLELMVYISRNFSVPVTGGNRANGEVNENIQLAIGYIRSHLDRSLSLDELADEVGLSKFYFAREFKRVTGITVVSYINRLRCRNAGRLLAKRDCTIHEAALKCGFENDSYFSKTFRKYMGVLPSDYIKDRHK